MIDIINPDTMAPPVRHYSAAAVHGGLCHTSGVVAFDQDNNIAGVGDIAVQTRTALENLVKILTASGTTLANIVSLTVYLRDLGDYDAFDRAYEAFVGEVCPPRAVVRTDLVLPDLLIEFQAVAAVPTDPA